VKIQTIFRGDARFFVQGATRETASREELDPRAGALFKMFLEPERAFGFNPAVVAGCSDIVDEASGCRGASGGRLPASCAQNGLAGETGRVRAGPGV
jgi:hypothetical protein